MTQGVRNKTRRFLPAASGPRSTGVQCVEVAPGSALQLAEGEQGAAQDPAGSDVKCSQKTAPLTVPA